MASCIHYKLTSSVHLRSDCPFMVLTIVWCSQNDCVSKVWANWSIPKRPLRLALHSLFSILFATFTFISGSSSRSKDSNSEQHQRETGNKAPNLSIKRSFVSVASALDCYRARIGGGRRHLQRRTLGGHERDSDRERRELIKLIVG